MDGVLELLPVANERHPEDRDRQRSWETLALRYAEATGPTNPSQRPCVRTPTFTLTVAATCRNAGPHSGRLPLTRTEAFSCAASRQPGPGAGSPGSVSVSKGDALAILGLLDRDRLGWRADPAPEIERDETSRHAYCPSLAQSRARASSTQNSPSGIPSRGSSARWRKNSGSGDSASTPAVSDATATTW